MKKFFYVGILLGAALVLNGCAGSSSPASTSTSSLKFNAAPWTNGSTADYQWKSDSSGADIGTSQYSFTQQNGDWIIKETDKIGELNQNVEMKIDASTLKPLGETKSIQTSSTNVQLTTTYANGKLNINADVNGKAQTASVDVPANALDNDQLLMTLRALPFAEGYKFTFVNIVAQNATKVNTTITVLSKENVDVPAGSFEAWRVELQAGQATQYIWYQVAAPHQLLKYDNGTNQMVLTK